MIREERNPNIERPLDPEDEMNPYIKKEEETRPQKIERYKKVRELLKKATDEAVGVKDKKILKSFKEGRGD